MKRIINGKTYNTDTAIEITGASNSDGQNNSWTTLYRTKKGNYFIHENGTSCFAINSIIIVDKNGRIYDENEYASRNIHKWLKCNEIEDLPERELKLFKIEEA
ncbi:MAG TPA: hypothetical protein ENI61_05310 [Ignavibacteria bacterium]|nr:hypothetical protein [Ignavibacteria bacterium]